MDQHYAVGSDPTRYKAAHMFRRPELDPRRTAIVVIDMINRCAGRNVGMMPGMAANGVDTSYYLDRVDNVVVPNLNRLLDAGRERGARIVHVKGGCYAQDYSDVVPQMQINYREWNALAGSMEMETLPTIHEDPTDITVIKAASGGFASDLDLRLRNMRIEQVIYTGVVTNGCVLCTVTAGIDLGYHGWFVSDTTATFSDRLQENTEEIIGSYMAKVVDTDEMLSVLVGADVAAAVA